MDWALRGNRRETHCFRVGCDGGKEGVDGAGAAPSQRPVRASVMACRGRGQAGMVLFWRGANYILCSQR